MRLGIAVLCLLHVVLVVTVALKYAKNTYSDSDVVIITTHYIIAHGEFFTSCIPALEIRVRAQGKSWKHHH